MKQKILHLKQNLLKTDSFRRIAEFFSQLFSRNKVHTVFKHVKKVKHTKVSVNTYDSDIQLALVPIILLIILSIVKVINGHYTEQINTNKLMMTDSSTNITSLPMVDQNSIAPNITAKAAIIFDAASQTTLFSKNPEIRFSMASTTKIMTALTALEFYQPNSVLTIHTFGIPGSGLGFQVGEQWYFEDLLYAMLLPSANDAAYAIADNYPGGIPAFVNRMNEKAAALHLADTHYADSDGLDDDEDFTTVVDLARLASAAMENKAFAAVVGTKYRTIYNVNYTRSFALQNLNQLLGKDGVNGVKTGTTEAAGEVLVTSFVSNDRTYIVIVMNSQDRFADTKTLMNFTKKNVRYLTPDLPLK